MKFGEKLRIARKRAGYTQEELAKKLDVSLRTISNYETGKSYPKQRKMYGSLSDILKVDINWLLVEDEDIELYKGNENSPIYYPDGDKIVREVMDFFYSDNFTEDEKDSLMIRIQNSYWEAKKGRKGAE